MRWEKKVSGCVPGPNQAPLCATKVQFLLPGTHCCASHHLSILVDKTVCCTWFCLLLLFIRVNWVAKLCWDSARVSWAVFCCCFCWTSFFFFAFVQNFACCSLQQCCSLPAQTYKDNQHFCPQSMIYFFFPCLKPPLIIFCLWSRWLHIL